jgi:DNA-binding transcriptional MerR regulator/methanogenic corrinoid protein MtbC1
MVQRKFEIQYVSRITGLNPHRIRAWERRYGAVTPHRTPSNRRLYSKSDIKRLGLLLRAVTAGHRISQIATLDGPTLESLAAGLQEPRDAPRSPSLKLDKTLCNAGFDAVCRFDVIALHRVLAHGAVRLTHRQLICGLIQPLMTRIGRSWAAGKLKTGNEHMATAAVLSLLGELLRDALPSIASAAPAIVVTTPSGNRHELGALSLALTATDAGWKPIYLGADLPAADMVDALMRTGARGVATSISHALAPALTVRELARLRRLLPRRAVLIAGGPGAVAVRSMDALAGVQWCGDVDSFQTALDALARRANEER